MRKAKHTEITEQTDSGKPNTRIICWLSPEGVKCQYLKIRINKHFDANPIDYAQSIAMAKYDENQTPRLVMLASIDSLISLIPQDKSFSSFNKSSIFV